MPAIDVAITDYSSVAFDSVYMRISIFLYMDNYKEYVEDRGQLLWEWDEIPFPMMNNNSSLSESIINFRYDDYLEKLEHTSHEMGLLEDGNATKRVISIIEAKMII